jgi:hypothetical protein
MKAFKYSFLLLIILCSVYSSNAQESNRKIKTKSLLFDIGGNYWNRKGYIPFKPQSDFAYTGYHMTSQPGLQTGLLWNVKISDHINLRTGGVLFLRNRRYESDTQSLINTGRPYNPLIHFDHNLVLEIPIMAELKYNNIYFVAGLKKHFITYSKIKNTHELGVIWSDWSKVRYHYPFFRVSPTIRMEYQFQQLFNTRAYLGFDYRRVGSPRGIMFYQMGFCIPIINK